jgi:hypothetical protein
MTVALDQGDLALLHDLTTDLGLMSEVRANSTNYTLPDGVRKQISALLGRLDRRVDLFTN